MCSFVRSVLVDNVTEDRNLNVAAYLLLAFGDTRGTVFCTQFTTTAVYCICFVCSDSQ